MSELVVGILGFACIVALVITLFKSKTMPSMAFIIFPSILALILVAGGYYSIDQIGDLIKGGFKSTGPTAALFVFSVLFFGIMTDAGMFDVIINKLMKHVGDNVIGVTVMTALIALIGHLDGGGASTFLIVVPAMLPVYKKMHMRQTTLLRVAVLAMGVLNLMPWAGPTMRAASVLGMEAGQLWGRLIPIQIFGIILCLAHAVFAGIQEKKRGAGLNGKLAQQSSAEEAAEEAQHQADENEYARPKLFAFNICLTIAVIAMLVWDQFPSYFPFMLGVAAALLVNYTPIKMQKKMINRHAGPALMMCSTLMGAAVLMGVLVYGFNADGAAVIAKPGVEMMKTSVVSNMAGIISMILPAALGQHLPLVIGILSVPLALCFDTDSYFYGMLPVMIAIGASFGVEAFPIAVAMVVCRNCATFISPMVPATLLGIGLADVDIKDHIKASFGYVWIFSILCMLFAVMLGTGLRVGEVTGLRWCDIDLEDGIIDVNHTLVYYDHRTSEGKKGCYFNVNTPKTEAGNRQVPMLDFVKEAFVMEKERQELLGVHCEATIDGYTDFIFLNRFGQPQHQSTLNKAIRRIIRDCNDEQFLKTENPEVLLPHFSCHSLRHTFTTRMCEAGVNIKVIQDTLGHKDITTTLNIYTDVTKELKRTEFDGLDKYFNNSIA